MKMPSRRRVFVVASAMLFAGPATAQSLRGSPASVDRQHEIALQHEYSFLETTRDVDQFVKLGLLVPITGGEHYALAAVSYPYARPAVKTFIERLSRQYEAACGEELIVTSLTRPTDRQPRNASEISVHPAGMAVDLRVSNRSSCRKWLEKSLLSLEKTGVIDATKERRPVHYHVAVFPTRYLAYADSLDAAPRALTPPESKAIAGPMAKPSSAGSGAGPFLRQPEPPALHRVNPGDSLWSIAKDYGTSVERLKSINRLSGSKLLVGQTIRVRAH